MSFRRFLLFCHLWAALIASVFLLLLGVTGSFIVYERGIDRVVNRRLIEVQPTGQFGWPTQLLACTVSLVLPILTITGTLIWWNRGRRFFPGSIDETK